MPLSTRVDASAPSLRTVPPSCAMPFTAPLVIAKKMNRRPRRISEYPFYFSKEKAQNRTAGAFSRKATPMVSRS